MAGRYPQEPGFVAGCETSQAAAESVAEGAASMRRRILAYIRSRGQHGSTCDEAEQHFQMRHQTCSARIRELALAKAIYARGDVRRTSSGRWARVYRANMETS